MKNRKKDTRWLVGVAMMAAIVVLLANTPLGMIQLPIIKATTTHIPVIIGAILLGPMAGAVLGGVFGLCSLVSNTVAPVAASICFSPFLAVSVGGMLGAVKALWVSVGCRILIGVAAGWLWIALKKIRVHDAIALPLVGAAGAMTNTAAVMGSIFFLFRAEYAAANNLAMSAVFDFIMATVVGSGVMEAIAAAILVTAIGIALLRVNRTRTLPAYMLLAIDIGNSNIVIGGIDGDDIRFEARIATDRIKTSDQYGVEIKNMLDLFSVSVEEVEDCIISSVVPPVFNAVCTGVIKLTGLNPMVVGPGIKTGLNIQMDDPASVGSDRIVIAVAALLEYAPPLLLVDLGTATTIEVVDQGNTYLGGAIMPGVRVSAEALSSRAAQLPGIQLDRPRRLIGKNTVECMRSGIMYGAAAMLDGMIERMEEELGKSTTVVATGGMAQFVAPLCKREMKVEKDLLLKGLNAIYKKNKK